MPESPLESLVASMTLSELSTRSGKTVSQIVEWALGGRGVRRGNSAPAAGGLKRVDTRTPVGRDAYDEQVLAAVEGAKGPIGAGEVREQVGGTALQARTALNRLIEAGKINYEGRARATRYTPA
jgi:hypothetical protein